MKRAVVALGCLAWAGCSHGQSQNNSLPAVLHASRTIEGVEEYLKCNFSNVVCLRPDGAPFGNEILPTALSPDGNLFVVVVSEASDNTHFPATIAVDNKSRAGADGPSTGVTDAAVKIDQTKPEWEKVAGLGYFAHSISLNLSDVSEYVIVVGPTGSTRKFHISVDPPPALVSFGINVIIPISPVRQRVEPSVPPSGGPALIRTKSRKDVSAAFVARTTLDPVARYLTRGRVPLALRGLGIEVGLRISPEFSDGIRLKEPWSRVNIGATYTLVDGAWLSAGVVLGFDSEKVRAPYTNGMPMPSNRDDAVEGDATRAAPYFGFGANDAIFSSARKALAGFGTNQRQQNQ